MCPKYAVQVLETLGWRTYDHAETEEKANEILEQAQNRYRRSQWRIVAVEKETGSAGPGRQPH